MDGLTEKAKTQAYELLQKALQVEYSFITSYRHFVSLVPDSEVFRALVCLAEDSAQHAGTVAEAIRALGGVPEEPLQEAPSGTFRDTLKRQLEYERLALFLHSQAAGLLKGEWRERLRSIAETERTHVKMVQDIISQTS